MLVAETPLHKQGPGHQSFGVVPGASPSAECVVEETPAKAAKENQSETLTKPGSNGQ